MGNLSLGDHHCEGVRVQDITRCAQAGYLVPSVWPAFNNALQPCAFGRIPADIISPQYLDRATKLQKSFVYDFARPSSV